MQTLSCTTGQPDHRYFIYIEKGITDLLYEREDVFGGYDHFVLITDKKVGKLHGGKVRRQLQSFNCPVTEITVEQGENSKRLENVQMIVDKMVHAGANRRSVIVALGGGVVGDLAGFCASIYMRGIDVIHLPTTLLAQVDSAIGGKTGVDLKSGKNLVGTFHQPKAVIVDPLLLETLPDDILADGMAEVIKYGCISSSKLFVRLLGYEYQEDLLEDMEDIIAKCIQIKINVVEKDEKEGGIRRILNFGHTIGHVIETYFNYEKYTHGEAVAIGMYQITKMSVREGITEQSSLENLKLVLDTYGLPTEMPEMSMDGIKEVLFRDKKMESDLLHLCVMPKIGKAEIVQMKRERAMALFQPEPDPVQETTPNA